ncbi:hypothetical protein JXR93_09075 [bacterium]|nr:hypothetical protein [bacterium]
MYKLKLKYSYIPMIISGTIILVVLWLMIIEPFYKEYNHDKKESIYLKKDFIDTKNIRDSENFNVKHSDTIENSIVSEIKRGTFLIKGDLSESELDIWWKKTIKWSTTMLEKQFNLNPPQKKMVIWIFKNSQSYRFYSKKLFDIDPETPYGYFLPSQNTIVINVNTGGGTLVHELVHPYLEANFKNIPVWINEGIASLYEQCSEIDGEMKGLTNWRLLELQEAIFKNSIPSFKELSDLTKESFYNSNKSSLYYAQSRYLFYYLQEKNLLKSFILELKNSLETDLTGYKTVEKILDIDDWSSFEKDWKKFVLNLRFDN